MVTVGAAGDLIPVVPFLLLIALHAAVAAAMPWAARRAGRWAFPLAGIAPAAAAAWAASQAPRVAAGEPVAAALPWAPELGLELAFRLDALALAMVALVSGVGMLVLVYCAWYFAPGGRGLGLPAGVLVAFAGAMLGLVVADNLFVLYAFWELTTVCSFLLIGYQGGEEGRRAALQALLVTTGPGLCTLLGFVLLGQAAGTYRISALLADPPAGGLVPAALALVLAGALAKSAQVPLHAWLPAAMVAPTPVSAYLHAAAMVKAGVYLVARLAPAFSEAPPWRPLVLSAGIASMLAGGWWALRQDDLKRLLAFGTVSQLGFLTALLGAGTRAAALAGVVMLLAHGLFKAALFLVAGVLDHQAGTRRMSELSGAWRSLPLAFLAAALATASMVGLPPSLGYLGKEAALSAFLTGGGRAALAGIAAGSALTAAYGALLLRGAFGGAPPRPQDRPRRAPWGLAAPALALALAGLAAGLLPERVAALAGAYAAAFPPAGEPYALGLWHGLTPALGLSALALLAGLVLYLARGPVTRARAAAPESPSAEGAFWGALRAQYRLALAVTRRVQVGSLPAYLAVALLTVLAIPGSALLAAAVPGLLAGAAGLPARPWSTPLQAVLGAAVLACAAGAARARRRLHAVLLLSGAGYGVGALFAAHGAPDLALTQFLVETLLLIMLVLALRRLPAGFPEAARQDRRARLARAGLAGALGALLGAFLVTAASARAWPPVSRGYAGLAGEAGGRNLVNLILIDFRALDTLGEVTVLAVAAVGVASLVLVAGGELGPPLGGGRAAGAALARRAAPRERWLAAPGPPPLGPRSVLLDVTARVLGPTMLVFSAYLLFAGHDQVGGGFAGGLVAGMSYALRYIAGGRSELEAAAPAPPAALLAGGLLVVTGTAAAPLAAGMPLLASGTVEGALPLVGHAKLVTSLAFEIGVYALVIGLILTLLRALGAGAEEQEGGTEEGSA